MQSEERKELLKSFSKGLFQFDYHSFFLQSSSLDQIWCSSLLLFFSPMPKGGGDDSNGIFWKKRKGACHHPQIEQKVSNFQCHPCASKRVEAPPTIDFGFEEEGENFKYDYFIYAYVLDLHI